MLATTRRLGIGRLGHVALEAGGSDLLEHIAPSGASLYRQGHRPADRLGGELVVQPASESGSVRLPDPSPPHLPAVGVHHVEGDLASMQIQPTYHAHHGPPRSPAGISDSPNG